MVRWDRFTQLLQRPGRRGVRGHIGMQNPAGRVFHHHKHIEEAKGRRDHHAEVTGDDRLGMIADKGSPALRCRTLPSASGSERFGRYLRTVRGDTRRPSLSNSSLAMRSSPQDGLSRAIRRMSACRSGGIGGRPGWISSARTAGILGDASGSTLPAAQ